jgi:hypothetical protein
MRRRRRGRRELNWGLAVQLAVTLGLVAAAAGQRASLRAQAELNAQVDSATNTVWRRLFGEAKAPKGRPGRCTGSTVELDGSCWVRTAEKPPCPRDQRREGEQCYYPVPQPRSPQAGEGPYDEQ